jgi:hypothetical protein
MMFCDEADSPAHQLVAIIPIEYVDDFHVAASLRGLGDAYEYAPALFVFDDRRNEHLPPPFSDLYADVHPRQGTCKGTGRKKTPAAQRVSRGSDATSS